MKLKPHNIFTGGLYELCVISFDDIFLKSGGHRKIKPVLFEENWLDNSNPRVESDSGYFLFNDTADGIPNLL